MPDLTPTNMRIISAPSILGLKPTGVRFLGKSLLEMGVAGLAGADPDILYLADPNHQYNPERDESTGCLNSVPLLSFCAELSDAVTTTLSVAQFPLVLGGDCSILLGIMPALKAIDPTGLVFLDAHADFYSPETSTTGEVADMDLAIVAGYGPPLLTNINDLGPYVDEEDIIHIGQRDQDETLQYNSPQINETAITCISAKQCHDLGSEAVAELVQQMVVDSGRKKFWIHFDTDVLHDDINPSVDYRLPGGLSIEYIEHIVSAVLSTGKCTGMSVTIYNPLLDPDGVAGRRIASAIQRFFTNSKNE